MTPAMRCPAWTVAKCGGLAEVFAGAAPSVGALRRTDLPILRFRHRLALDHALGERLELRRQVALLIDRGQLATLEAAAEISDPGSELSCSQHALDYPRREAGVAG